MTTTTTGSTPEPLIRVQNLKKHFPITAGVFRRQVGTVKAVDGISFDLLPKETLGLVGESGCGKTTAGRTVLNLYTATEGKVYFGQTEVTALGGNQLRLIRQKMQMIFQDPQDSLNPRMTVGSIISEPLMEHTKASGSQRTERVEELLQAVGLNAKYMNRYPHEFSGGQRQRIGVARALALNPEFIICDEPIAALDVSIQAQVVNLLEDLQEKFGLTYLFISHDLGMIRHIARRVAVMYLGHIVEIATSQDLYRRPQHPYTQALLSAVPTHDPVREQTRERIILTGDVPSPADPPSGCPFRTRCPSAESKCAEEVPELRQIGTGHRVACHLVA
jgi:oligopeptide transport system ATP-binding protein